MDKRNRSSSTLISQKHIAFAIVSINKQPMFGAKKRRTVTPVKQQTSNILLRDHVIQKTDAQNVLVSEYDVLENKRPIPFWKRDLKIPQWLLMILVSLAIIVFTAFAVFGAIVTLKKESDGGPCKSNSDCRQDLGLMCNNYRCGCGYSHFWSDSYNICERRRMINRTCYNDSMCDILASLECHSVILSGGDVQSQCQCKAGMTWNGYTCGFQTLHNTPCVMTANCDTSRFLYCNITVGLCYCNSSMFWNGNANSGTCEYKRTVGQYCYPYNDNWCDDTGPVGQGLTCAAYTNPYGNEYGVCQCSTYEFYNGTASLGNGFCEPLHVYNQPCASTSQCDYRIQLVCLNNLCTCGSGKNYDGTINSGGVMGFCKIAAGYLDNCTSAILCSTSQGLFCDFSYYGGLNTTGVCLCNSSWSYWDGIECASKLSIGGVCSSNTNCISSDGLFCSNYTLSLGTCDCDQNHFWNYTCVLKQWYNTTCSSSYVCDDNRGLQCQGLGGIMFQKCDCYNSSFIWNSLYVTNGSNTCVPKLSNGVSPCYGNLDCQDFNYLQCNNGTCGCNYIDYWDGNRCQPKRNYTDPCANITQCRDFNPVDLICRMGTTVPPALQCLCVITSYWEQCQQACVVAKERHQPCTLTGNCTSNECDVTKNLQCINDTFNNQTASGWCNCTSLQWWNGTYCRNKGVPAWGTNASADCIESFQCADYNLVSCPLGGNFPVINGTCECATTKYWNGYTCLDRVLDGQACTSWPQNPVNTNTCLSAAGAGLLCNSTNCLGGSNCTGGFCHCPTGSVWNSTFLICATTATG